VINKREKWFDKVFRPIHLTTLAKWIVKTLPSAGESFFAIHYTDDKEISR